MEHLTRESLARLVNEAPAPGERRHLEACFLCREELEALHAQTEALGSLPDLRPPRGDWEELEARLLSEGLVRGGDGRGGPLLWTRPGWVQAAAVLVVFVGGAALGSGFTRMGEGAPQLEPASLAQAPLEGASELVALPYGQAENLDDARDAVRVAEQNYIAALVQYRSMLMMDGGDIVLDDPASRYAALDALVRASQAAVRQNPADPFLNGFLASASAEQEAVLRRISTASDNWY